MKKWGALVVLGAAQFLMVIDTSVMNVSISTLVKDFNTDVTTIQGVITLYSLVMAALMITGGKLGDIWGRRRAFSIGLVIYGTGSLITALAPTVGVLAFGWSVLEGMGAALVMPALAALVAGNYSGKDRTVAFGVIGGISGAAVAVGPIIGGWVTTYLTWRVVFAAEVVVVIAILIARGVLGRAEEEAAERPPKLDVVGAILCAATLALVVLGVLESSTWGWIKPRNSPVEPFGFSLTLFVIAAGFVVGLLFRAWERRRVARSKDPLARLELLRIPPLRAGLATLLSQQLILMGVFFVIPLYLQIVLGYNAFETGVKLLPVSVTLLLASLLGSRLAARISPRLIIRIGLAVLCLGALGLLAAVKPALPSPAFGIASGVLGIGIGLLASQIGAVLQNAVGDKDRSEVGGFQYTAQNLGSALGTAFIGGVVIAALASTFSARLASDPRVSQSLQAQIGVRLESGVKFVSTAQVADGLAKAGVPPDEAAVVVDNYGEAQLQALKLGLLLAALLAVGAFWFTQDLPSTVVTADQAAPTTPEPASAA